MYWWKVAVLKGPLELRRCFFLFFFLSGFSKSGLSRFFWCIIRWVSKIIDLATLQGTNISPKNGILKMIFLFPRWDMLIPWRVMTSLLSSFVVSGS